MRRIRIEAELVVEDPEDWGYEKVSGWLEEQMARGNREDEVAEIIVRDLGTEPEGGDEDV